MHNRSTNPGAPRSPIASRHKPSSPPIADLFAPDTPIEAVTLLLQPTAAQQADLATLLAAQQNPSSPDFHRWLTPDQFGTRFGTPAIALAPLTTWLQQHHLHIDELAHGRNWLTLSGTSAQFQTAFHTDLHRFDVNGRQHFANLAAPSIPDTFRGLVSGFRGLHDFPLPPPHPNYNSTTGRHLLGPDDFATIYDLAPLYTAGIDASNQKIVIVGESTITPSDIATFRSTFLLPVNTPQLLLIGPTPGNVPDAELEADLDLEWSGAIARNATLIYVYARDVFTAVQAAVNQNLAPVISMSYGACEPQWPTALADRFLAQQANAQGITWVASSGDSGAAGCEAQASSPQATHGLAVQIPASIPEVTAIGGTQFDDSNDEYWNLTNSPTGASVKSYIPETAWNESSSAGLASGGGGASLLFPKPAWQTGLGVPSDHARDIPDISFNAALYTGYYVISEGKPYRVGGTSAGTPAFAGILALLNHYQVVHNANAPQPGLGNINPALYRLAKLAPAAFHDITNGNNIVPCQQATPGCTTGSYGYTATVGYDFTTGLGSLDVNNFITRWNTAQLPTTTTLSSSTPTVAANATVQLTAQVTPATATGLVTFLSATTTLGTAAPNTPFTLQASSLKLGANLITAVYSGDNLYAGSSATLSITDTLPATGAAIIPTASANPAFQDFFSGFWTANLKLSEIAGVSATLTGFTVDTTPLSINLFNATAIPAKGSIQASVTLTGLSIPVTRTFIFTGTDATGQKWTQSLPVTFLGPTIGPPILINSANGNTVYQDPVADFSCQWHQRIVVQELTGYAFQLTALTLGSADQTPLIARYFGTTHLAPYGLLQGDVCWPFPVAGQFLTLFIGGTGEQGGTGLAGIETTLAGPPQTSAQLSVSSGPPWQITVPPGTPWTATILPANPTTSWLTVTPQSGTGPATLTPHINSSTLPRGAYNATLAIAAPGTSPSSSKCRTATSMAHHPPSRLPA